MHTHRIAFILTLLGSVALTGCSAFESDDDSGRGNSVSIPAYQKGLTEEDQTTFTTTAAQVSNLAQASNTVDLSALRMAASDIGQYGAKASENMPTAQGLQVLQSTVEQFTQKVTAARQGCKDYSDTTQNRAVTETTGWNEPTPSAADPECLLKATWYSRTANSAMGARENVSVMTSNVSAALLGTAREELAGGDVGTLTVSGNATVTQTRPVHNGEASQTTDDFKGMNLTLLNGSTSKIETSITESTKMRVIGQTQELKSTTRDTVVVFTGTSNPVVYKRHDATGADQITRTRITLNDIIVFETKN